MALAVRLNVDHRRYGANVALLEEIREVLVVHENKEDSLFEKIKIGTSRYEGAAGELYDQIESPDLADFACANLHRFFDIEVLNGCPYS